MRMVKSKNTKQMRKAFNGFMDMIDKVNDPDLLKEVKAEFNDWLDEYLANDFFGTEGQLDPRGDQRE